MSLKARLAIRSAVVLPIVAALMFVPAGSFRFWPGWIFVAVFAGFTFVFVAYFYRRDPRLLERRLQSKESRREQKHFQVLWMLLWTVTLVVPGLDYRFGWSEHLLGGVPVWLIAASWVVVVICWWWVVRVMQFNTFAAAVVQVEADQKVITDGPYRLVRHPMYSGFVLMILATPFSLASYIAVVPAVLLVPVIVFRLLDEEKLLRQELPGYTEYCKQTRFRLIPSVF